MKKGYLSFLIIIIIFLWRQLYSITPEFRKIIEDFMAVNSIKATITQRVYLENGSIEDFSGNYYAASKGLIRIDYLRPESQTVVVNDSGLYWYYPDRKILFLSKKNENSAGSIPAFMNVIPDESLKNLVVNSLGMRFYSFFKTAEVYEVTSKKSGTKLILWIDPVLKVVKRKYILDESGREIVREEYMDHTPVRGIYIPSKIELKARTSNGVIHTVTEYGNMVINSRIEKNVFKFKITPDMKVHDFGDN